MTLLLALLLGTAFAGPGIPWKPPKDVSASPVLPGGSKWRMGSPLNFKFSDGEETVVNGEAQGYAHWVKTWDDKSGRTHKEHLWYFNFPADYPSGKVLPLASVAPKKLALKKLIDGDPSDSVEGTLQGYPTLRYQFPSMADGDWDRERMHYFRVGLLGDWTGFPGNGKKESRWFTVALVYWHEWNQKDELSPSEKEPDLETFIRLTNTLRPSVK
jgi:hypothetical protein